MMTLGPNNRDIKPQSSSWNDFMPNATASAGSSSSLDPTIQAHQISTPTPDDISLFSVNDILSLYKHDTDLLKHVLAAKAQEDRRKTAEEFRQMEEARLRFKFADFDMDDFQTPTFSSATNQAQSPQNVSSTTFSESSLHASQYYDHQGSPSTQIEVLMSSPPSALMDQDLHSVYMADHQHGQPSSSATASLDSLSLPVMVSSQDFNLDIPTTSYSLPPSFVTSGSFTSHSPITGHNMTDIISTSSSVSSLESNPWVADLPTVRPLSDSSFLGQKNMQPVKNSNAASNARGIDKKKSASKHKRRQLSTTSLPGFSSSTHVLRWAPKKKRQSTQSPMVNVNKEPQAPLDHGTVMEALRAKLMRVQSLEQEPIETVLSSSPPTTAASPPAGSKTPPSPSPRSPPVDTQPSTGILFLDLKHKTARRKKSYSVSNDCRYQ